MDGMKIDLVTNTMFFNVPKIAPDNTHNAKVKIFFVEGHASVFVHGPCNGRLHIIPNSTKEYQNFHHKL